MVLSRHGLNATSTVRKVLLQNQEHTALIVYVMSRMQGISRLDFILAYGYPEDTPKICDARLTLINDVAT
jgi:hypothetical protein